MSNDAAAPNPIRSALYYPFPYVRDENWLKEQVFFWDRLYRIVPVGFREMEFRGQRVDPTTTELQLRDDLDFIQDFQVRPETHLAPIALRLRTLMFYSEWLQEQDEREYFTWGRAEATKVIPGIKGEDVFFTPSGAWRYVPGMVYIALLAKVISLRYGLPIVTDDFEHDSILKLDDLTHGGTDKPLGRRAIRLLEELGPITDVHDRKSLWDDSDIKGTTALLYSLLLPRVGCKNLDDVPVAQIIKFRQRYDGERRDFVDEVQRLASGLTARHFVSEAELRQYIGECAEKIDRKRRKLIAAIRGNKIDAVLRSSVISVPMVVAAALDRLPPIGAAIGGALGTSAVLYGYRRARQIDMAKDPIAIYTFLISKEFSISDYMSKLHQVSDRRWSRPLGG